MAYKFIILASLAAVARAGIVSYGAAPLAYSASPAISYSSLSAPVTAYAAPALATPAVKLAYAAPVAREVYPDSPPNYQFGYSVHDPHTGDSKSQEEIRQGDVVKGSYSLIEADGTRRTVEYAADDYSGFNAIVHKEPATVAVKAIAPVITKTAPFLANPVAYAAPAVGYAAAPAISYSGIAAPLGAVPAYAKLGSTAYYH